MTIKKYASNCKTREELLDAIFADEVYGGLMALYKFNDVPVTAQEHVDAFAYVRDFEDLASYREVIFMLACFELLANDEEL